MTIATHGTPPAAPPAPPLNRCGSCAMWWGKHGHADGVCTLLHCPQRRDAVACPDWRSRAVPFDLRRLQ